MNFILQWTATKISQLLFLFSSPVTSKNLRSVYQPPSERMVGKQEVIWLLPIVRQPLGAVGHKAQLRNRLQLALKEA
jgi:hypothetical protein